MRRWRDERGAVLVQTGIALIALLAMGTLTIDYGMLLVARGQAQNSADAGALASAISLAFGDSGDTARAKAVGVATARANPVWGEAPDVLADDVYVISPGSETTCPVGGPGEQYHCVRVDVYRNAERHNPLPTWFGGLVGVNSHGVKATATAQVAMGVGATCVKPWIIPDKWNEVLPAGSTFTIDSTFEWPGDFYLPPISNSPGSGYTVPQDVGMRLNLRLEWLDGNIGTGSVRIINGVSDYRENIATCNPASVAIGQIVESDDPGAVTALDTEEGLDALIGSPAATWVCADGSDSSGRDCIGYPSIPGTPQLVLLSAFDVQKYLEDGGAANINGAGRVEITVSRMLGFFIENWNASGEISGRLAYYTDRFPISRGLVDARAKFLRKVILVR